MCMFCTHKIKTITNALDTRTGILNKIMYLFYMLSCQQVFDCPKQITTTTENSGMPIPDSSTLSVTQLSYLGWL